MRVNTEKEEWSLFNIAKRRGIKYLDIKGYPIDKLRLLNGCIPKKAGWSSKEYRAYVLRFKIDEDFNTLYAKWIESGSDRKLKPSLDHKTPVKREGDHSLGNLQFLTLRENQQKGSMTNEEWERKKNAKLEWRRWQEERDRLNRVEEERQAKLESERWEYKHGWWQAPMTWNEFARLDGHSSEMSKEEYSSFKNYVDAWGVEDNPDPDHLWALKKEMLKDDA